MGLILSQLRANPRSPTLSLETAQYVSQLEETNPAATDMLRQADDHIRLIKSVLKNTFPNITGPIQSSQDQIDAEGFSMPIGVVSLWYGSSNTVPAGWAICNGQTVSRTDNQGTITLPDLRGKVALGASTAFLQGQTYGAEQAAGTTDTQGAHSHTVAGGGTHTHTVTVAGHALTVAEMPAHTHDVACGTAEGDNPANFTNGGSSTGPAVTTSSTGSGTPHTHDATLAGDGSHTHTTDTQGAHAHNVTVSTIQPSLALHYIMKV